MTRSEVNKASPSSAKDGQRGSVTSTRADGESSSSSGQLKSPRRTPKSNFPDGHEDERVDERDVHVHEENEE